MKRYENQDEAWRYHSVAMDLDDASKATPRSHILAWIAIGILAMMLLSAGTWWVATANARLAADLIVLHY
jgi:hypothetical protein